MLNSNYISPFRNPFESFWMAGFECTDKLNCFGNRVDFLKVTGHLDKLDEDYKNIRHLSFKTVREGLRWSIVETAPYQYNWADAEKIIRAAKENDIQVVWDICHFGYPDDLTPLHPMFARRFAALCRNFIKFYRNIDSTGTLIVTPFNEVSFLSWLGGDVCGTTPYCRGYGWEVKYHIMKAYIEGVEAIMETDSNTRLMTTEPLVNMVPPLNATDDEVREAAKKHEEQFQVLDILSGRMCPELRGKPEYIDIIGCNYYFNNQWITDSCEFLPWANETNDPRWLPLSTLIKQLYDRYQRPVVLSETSHPLADRPKWMNFIARECKKVIETGVPLWGICWYPIIDRPDWDHLEPWHNAGVWDIDNSEGKLTRVLHRPTAEAILNSQLLLKDVGSGVKVMDEKYEIS
jgi:beta-glucosidase/6-phospho-beta-glucosidase/beta-galactosidase